MKWVKKDENQRLPIKSWCEEIEPGAEVQALNLANHPVLVNHVALMPDCHQGYGMPIGGVIACRNAVIPNAVGVDIGCGMGAIQTNLKYNELEGMSHIRSILEYIKERIPVGEGHAHKEPQNWEGFDNYLADINISRDDVNSAIPEKPQWLDKAAWTLAEKNLGTLGGGNHFVELQKNKEGYIWLMLHSGSRNLGYRIASYYHQIALKLNQQWQSGIPDTNLAFLPMDSKEGDSYVRDMNFAMAYALENRNRMMKVFKDAITAFFSSAVFEEQINIHHNYAALENHYGSNVWVHRKGATSAKNNETGIIPGSMGTSSYIVKGKGNPESFESCSHGAGRVMSRTAACENLTIEDCNQAMEGIVFDRWNKFKPKRRKSQQKRDLWDLSEAPLAYKDIDTVIESELDLIEPVEVLKPLGVIKG